MVWGAVLTSNLFITGRSIQQGHPNAKHSLNQVYILISCVNIVWFIRFMATLQSIKTEWLMCITFDNELSYFSDSSSFYLLGWALPLHMFHVSYGGMFRNPGCVHLLAMLIHKDDRFTLGGRKLAIWIILRTSVGPFGLISMAAFAKFLLIYFKFWKEEWVVPPSSK